MTFMPTRCKVRSILMAFLLVLAGSGQAYSRDLHRALFYNDTPFGSLAWVKNAQTRNAARTRYKIEDLTPERCVDLPRSGSQWFLINHSDSNISEKKIGYFSIIIIYSFSEDNLVISNQNYGLYLQRNSGWYSGSNKIDSFDLDPSRISMKIEEFIDIHNATEGKEDESLEYLNKKIGVWHASLVGDGPTSWQDRYLYGARLRAYLTPDVKAISARLVRFMAIDGSSSRDPVLFWLDPIGANSAIILVDAPRQENVGARRVYSVRFDGRCSSEN